MSCDLRGDLSGARSVWRAVGLGLWACGLVGVLVACDGDVDCPTNADTGFNVRLECGVTVLASEGDEASVRIRREGGDAWVECPRDVADTFATQLCGQVDGRSVSFSCTGVRPFTGALGELFRDPPVRFEIAASFVAGDGATWEGASRVTWKNTAQGCLASPKSAVVEMARE